MMNEAQIAERLCRIHERLAVKIGGQPWNGPRASITSDGSVHITLNNTWSKGTEAIASVGGDTFAETLDAADAFIDTMPTPEERALQDFMKAVATAIEKGRDAGVDLAYLNPLSETMKRLSENAITHQDATQ